MMYNERNPDKCTLKSVCRLVLHFSSCIIISIVQNNLVRYFEVTIGQSKPKLMKETKPEIPNICGKESKVTRIERNLLMNHCFQPYTYRFRWFGIQIIQKFDLPSVRVTVQCSQGASRDMQIHLQLTFLDWTWHCRHRNMTSTVKAPKLGGNLNFQTPRAHTLHPLHDNGSLIDLLTTSWSHFAFLNFSQCLALMLSGAMIGWRLNSRPCLEMRAAFRHEPLNIFECLCLRCVLLGAGDSNRPI